MIDKYPNWRIAAVAGAAGVFMIMLFVIVGLGLSYINVRVTSIENDHRMEYIERLKMAEKLDQYIEEDSRRDSIVDCAIQLILESELNKSYDTSKRKEPGRNGRK